MNRGFKSILLVFFALVLVSIGLIVAYLSVYEIGDDPIGDLVYEDEKVEDDEVFFDVVIFHNGKGPMCLEALDFFRQEDIDYEEHLNSDSNFVEQLQIYQAKVPISEGISSNYGYYPFIFVGDRAFSGFDSEIQKEIEELIK